MMKIKHMRAVAFAVMILFLAASFPTPAKADISFGFSYSSLSPHGSWLVSTQYGRVWRPSVAVAGWNPYYDGHWVYTDLGWTWVSDYSWGAIPYHYGTWIIEPGIGWVWLPGEVWAPSWVVFCDGPDYIGWAPVPPHYSVGVSVGFRDIGYDRFVVVPTREFLSPRIRTIAVPQSRTQVIINKTKIVNRISVQNNVVINNGPDVSVVERATHKRVKAVPIERVHRVSPHRRVDREQLRFDKRRGGRPRAAEPVSVKSTRSNNDRRESVEKRRGDNRRQAGSTRVAPAQRREKRPESSPSVREGSRRDVRKQMPSAAPAKKKAPVKEQPPPQRKAKRPPKDQRDNT